MPRKTGMMLLVVANVMCWCVLSLYQMGVAQTGSPPPTIANPVEQRKEMVDNLEQIRNLLKEQNEMMRTGQVKVIVTELPKN
jgi:hypothetical protein